jgi:EmrB/QacA subfamily drug resistance transporter
VANIIMQPCDKGVVLSAAPALPCARSQKQWVLAATILGSSLAFIDGTVVNVALPALQTSLNATAAEVQWVVEAYSLLLAALLLVGGSLGDQYGRRRVFALGVSIFAVTSGLCGLAPEIRFLIAARAAQGIGAALLIPGSLAIISASFEKEERGRAIGTWSGFSAITSALGPVAGGWLVQHISWRAAFFINVPLALIVLAIAFARVPESRDPSASKRVDVAGALLATAGLGGLVYGLINSGALGLWHQRALIPITCGLASLALFGVVEARTRNPMLPTALFLSRNFTGANLLTLFLYTALGGTLFFFPLNLIQAQDYTPTQAGAAMLPWILLMFLLSRWSGGLVRRYGSKLPLVVGPLIAAAGYGLFLLPGVGGSYWTTFFPAVIVLGFGMAITVAPLTTTVMNSIPEHLAGVASGINNAVSRTAGLLSIAVLGLLMYHGFNAALDRNLSRLSLPPELRSMIDEQRPKLGAVEVPPSEDPDRAIQLVIAESFVSGFRLVTLGSAGLALVSSLCAWLIIERRE